MGPAEAYDEYVEAVKNAPYKPHKTIFSKSLFAEALELAMKNNDMDESEASEMLAKYGIVEVDDAC